MSRTGPSRVNTGTVSEVATLRKWASWAIDWAKRVPEKFTWERAAVVALALVVLPLFGWCNRVPDDPPTPETKVETVPLSVVQDLAESWADTNIGLWERLRGYESRPPERILVTRTVEAPPPVCSPVTVIKDNRLSTPVYTQSTDGWDVRVVEDVDVTGCDGLRIVGGQVICDTPQLGKFLMVAGGSLKVPGSTLSLDQAGADAWAGIGWQRHRDSQLQLSLLYGIDQTARVRVEWRGWPW